MNLVETGIATEQINNCSTAAFVPSSIRPSEFLTFVYDNREINIESIYNKSYHCTNAIAIQRWQYPVLSEITESPPCNLEKVILRTWERSFKPVTEPVGPAIKKYVRIHDGEGEV